MSDRTEKSVLIELREKAQELDRFSHRYPDDRDGYFLGFAVSRWVEVIAKQALSIALLLDNSDLDSALVLLRTFREKCIDLALLCSWDPPQEAALRAHIFQRLRHMDLAARNPDIAANPTLKEMEADLRDFQKHYTALYDGVITLDRVRGHWSGLKANARLSKAGINELKAGKIQALLSTEVHGSLDLAAKRDCTPEMIGYTAQYVADWIDKVMERLRRFPSGN